jgi:hypothetical protein
MEQMAEGVRATAVGFADKLKDHLHGVALRGVGEMQRE